MNEDELKKAFTRVKEDISFLTSEIIEIRQELESLKSSILNKELSKFTPLKTPTDTPTHPVENQIIQQITPTDDSPYNAQETKKHILSIRNEGVPTNQQTNQQTDQHSSISRGDSYIKSSFLPINAFGAPAQNPSPFQSSIEVPSINNVSLLLDSLDSIKKDLRLKFKRLTKQEILVFSTIYTVEETGEASYSSIAAKLKLSESSIRDYTNKIIEKGIPILKEKLDNKRVLLHISPELRKIASLDTLLKLREI